MRENNLTFRSGEARADGHGCRVAPGSSGGGNAGAPECWSPDSEVTKPETSTGRHYKAPIETPSQISPNSAKPIKAFIGKLAGLLRFIGPA